MIIFCCVQRRFINRMDDVLGIVNFISTALQYKIGKPVAAEHIFHCWPNCPNVKSFFDRDAAQHFVVCSVPNGSGGGMST
jgi:hypothetical protein